MIKKFYYWFHKKISRPEERGEYSSGRWQDIIRTKALEMCKEGRGNILEVGCGEGLFLVKLAKETQYIEISGVDIWEEILLKARKRLEKEKNVKLFKASACEMPFDDEYFDVVVSINVFFNLPSEKEIFKSMEEMGRVCKKRGRIIFDIRNSLNPLLFLKYRLARYYDETVKNIPLKTYRPGKILLFLESCGFEIINKIYIGFPHNRFAPIIIIEVKKK